MDKKQKDNPPFFLQFLFMRISPSFSDKGKRQDVDERVLAVKLVQSPHFIAFGIGKTQVVFFLPTPDFLALASFFRRAFYSILPSFFGSSGFCRISRTLRASSFSSVLIFSALNPQASHFGQITRKLLHPLGRNASSSRYR